MSDPEFKPKLGKPQSGPSIKAGRLNRIVVKANARHRKFKSRWGNGLTKRPVAELARGKGTARFDLNPSRPGQRRVIVKMRIAKHGTSDLGAARAHQYYIQRDGVTREGGPGELYDREQESIDGGHFLDGQKKDTYQFRMIVAPEDGARMQDLKPFVRELMSDMERDLGTKLDWVAVDHFNTSHPHTRIIIAGHDDKGHDLVMARDYISHAIRSRASDLVTRQLGLEPELERMLKLANQVKAERLTSLDRSILQAAQQNVRVVAASPDGGRQSQALRIGRLRVLETMGLAEERQTGVWAIDPQLESKLRIMGARGDIMVTMHNVMREHRLDRAAGDFAIFTGVPKSKPIVGKVVEVGIADEMTDSKFLVVDGIDGRIHYAETSKLGPHNSPEPGLGPEPGMIVALTGGNGQSKMRNAQVEIVSYWPIERLVDVEAATYLDKLIVADTRPVIQEKGFGAEVSKAIVAREAWLIEKGYAVSAQPGLIAPKPEMLRELAQKNLSRLADKLSRELGGGRINAGLVECITGRHVRTVVLPMHRLAVIKGSEDFTLVPWSRDLAKLRWPRRSTSPSAIGRLFCSCRADAAWACRDSSMNLAKTDEQHSSGGGGASAGRRGRRPALSRG